MSGHETQHRIFFGNFRLSLRLRWCPVCTSKCRLRPYGQGRSLRRLHRPRLVQRDIVLVPRPHLFFPSFSLRRRFAIAHRLDEPGRNDILWVLAEGRLLRRWSVLILRRHYRPKHRILYPLLWQDIRSGFRWSRWCHSHGVL